MPLALFQLLWIRSGCRVADCAAGSDHSGERDYIQRTTGIEFLPSGPCCGSPLPFGPAQYRLREVRPDGIRPLAELSSSGAQLTVAEVGVPDGAVLLLEPA